STSVRFGGIPATSFNVVNSNTITAIVATGASGNVKVTNQYGMGSLSGFVFAGPPVISSFLPTSSGAGQTVTITGVNFSNATAVSFGGTSAANFVIVSPTTIMAVVSTGSSGNVA